jgi:PEP-CTERM/exosortase A-associated glycosyltransferase
MVDEMSGKPLAGTTSSMYRSYRVLHVLDHSLPVLSGYSIRSKSIVETQQKLGHRVQVVTGTAHQLDDPTAEDTVMNGVPYARTALSSNLQSRAITRRWPLLRELSAVWLLRQRILAVLDLDAFDVIHAHSPSLCGLAAWSVAAPRSLPFVYEIRGFWEESAVDQNRIRRNSLRYRVSRALEEFVVRRADGLVGISRNILEDLEARGIEPRKLSYVSNGVDPERFFPRPRDADLSAKLDLTEGEPVLGFIGSLWGFEGISWLVRAAVQLRRRGIRFRLLIVGHGEEAAGVRMAIKELDARDFILFHGPVPNEEVHRYYSVMDVLVYPRRRMRLTEKVTPLKPLEAMAQGKAVLGSNVGGIRELVRAEETGLLFNPEDIDDFCRQAARILTDVDLRHRLGDQGRRAVLRERDWRLLACQYDAVYEKAIRRHQTAP